MTEVTSAATVSEGIAARDLPEDDWQWSTIGRAMPLTDVRVFDAGDRECAPGEIGEIRMRGPLVMKGYWRNPEATAQAIRDGWLCSGDLGRADRSEEHTSELQSLMRISYAVFCLKTKNTDNHHH